MATQETSAPSAAQASLPGRDCRIYERHACSVETSCHPPTVWGNQDTHWPAQIRDVSQGGLALVLRRRFEKGAGLAIELPGSDPETPSTVLVRVVRISAQPGGHWLLGCSFVSALSEDEVQSLVDPRTLAGEQATVAATQTPAESISAVVPSRPSRILVTSVQLEGVLSNGQIIRRWLDRLHLHDAWPVPAGRRFLLRTNRGSAGKTGVRVEVESCTRRGSHWVLRCRFSQAGSDVVASVLDCQ